jgi:hypothetical protein
MLTTLGAAGGGGMAPATTVQEHIERRKNLENLLSRMQRPLIYLEKEEEMTTTTEKEVRLLQKGWWVETQNSVLRRCRSFVDKGQEDEVSSDDGGGE